MQRARKRYNVKAKQSNIYAKRSYRTKTISNDVIDIKCETNLNVYAFVGGTTVANFSSTNFWNAAAEITSSASWTTYSPIYQKYKITGLSIKVTPVHNQSNLCVNIASVPVHFVFYPALTNTGVNQSDVNGNDYGYRAEPLVTVPQSKYWKFPDKFFESTGTGYGIWCSVGSIGSQTGELAFGSHATGGTFLVEKLLYQVRSVYYIKLGYRKS